jgi:hypothetical protein
MTDTNSPPAKSAPAKTNSPPGAAENSDPLMQ